MAERILCRGNLFANWSTTGPAEGSSESEQVASHAQGRLRLVRKIVWLVGRFAMASRPFLDLLREYEPCLASRYSIVLPDNTHRKILYNIEVRFRSYMIFFLIFQLCSSLYFTLYLYFSYFINLDFCSIILRDKNHIWRIRENIFKINKNFFRWRKWKSCTLDSFHMEHIL